MKTNRKTLPTVLLLAPFIFSFALALDIYVPSIPEIHSFFHTSPAMVQLTVSLFLLMTGIGQLLVGPLSDNFGRRKVILTGTFLLLAGSLLASVAPSISMLILARMLQGAGSCSMMVATFAIVRDLFDGDEMARVYSFLNSTISLSPLLAPTAGGYLAKWYGWQASFVFLAVLAFLILLLGVFKIKESLAPENKVKLSNELFCNYLHILKSNKFRVYTFCASAGFAGFLTFFSVSSYIIIDLLHVPKEHFGLYFAAIGIIFFFGSLFSGYCAKKIGTYKSVLFGTVLMTLAGVVMLVWYYLWGLSIAAFMGPMMIMGIGGALMIGAGAGGAIEPFPEMAGAASALFGASEFVFSFIISTAILEWKVVSTIPLALTLLVLGFLSFVFCMKFYKCMTTMCDKKVEA